MTLRSILGGSRVSKKKRRQKASAPRTGSGNPTSSTSSSSIASSSWASSLPRTKPGSMDTGRTRWKADEHDESDNPVPQPEHASPLADPTVRDVPAAMRHIAAHMFDPLPERGSGLNSVSTALLLRRRAALPPLATTGHVAVLLGDPTQAERATVALVRAGKIRRVVVPGRGRYGAAELLVRRDALEGAVQRCPGLDGPTRVAFLSWLAANPSALAVVPRLVRAGASSSSIPKQEEEEPTLDTAQADALVRAGFLTACLDSDAGHLAGLFARPEDRHTLISLETVSRAAAGSFSAVGGAGAVAAVGGTTGGGGGGTRTIEGLGETRVAVPGAGPFFKLLNGALDHLADLLERAAHAQMPETDLRERWDGGGGVPLARMKKWRDFCGLSFEFLLREAVGAGSVEIFETGSVGRGVRLAR